MSALAVKALLYYEQIQNHRRSAPRAMTPCRFCSASQPCARLDLMRSEFDRIRKLALMPRSVWVALGSTTTGRAQQNRILTETGMAAAGYEKVGGRRRKIPGWSPS